MCQNSFFEKITPATNSRGRGNSFYLGIMTHPHCVSRQMLWKKFKKIAITKFELQKSEIQTTVTEHNYTAIYASLSKKVLPLQIKLIPLFKWTQSLIMGKPFKEELKKLSETIRWAEQQDVTRLAQFLFAERTSRYLWCALVLAVRSVLAIMQFSSISSAMVCWHKRWPHFSWCMQGIILSVAANCFSLVPVVRTKIYWVPSSMA